MAISIRLEKNGQETDPLVGGLGNPVRVNGSPKANVEKLKANKSQNKKKKHRQEIEKGTQIENRKTVFGRIARAGGVTQAG